MYTEKSTITKGHVTTNKMEIYLKFYIVHFENIVRL